MSVKRNAVVRMLAGTAAALGLAVALQAPASASAATATVTPSTGLTDGAVVQVDADGLTAGSTYDVGQCAFVPTGDLVCNPADFTQVTADAAGTATTPLTVRASYAGVLHDGTPWGTVDCTTTPCSVGLSDATGTGPAPVAISFQ
ncbi:enediyne antibiotic chromoprotein [Micromonospora sp. NPDC049523]|uniref:enediyne antibiotic chromoprotein n=1 Tax=Micromonospora sp. NPDC049523 TaxID=3155921 RepID=UPI00343CA20C